MSYQNLSHAILKDVRAPVAKLAHPYQHEPFLATNIAKRMNMIPSPAQAMTILRALNETDLKSYPIELLEILLPLLKELLNGEIKLYRSIPSDTFVRLNNVVHDALEKSQLYHKTHPDHPSAEQEIAEIQVGKEHVMHVLRAINSIPTQNLDALAQKRMKTVKQVLADFHHGNVRPIRQILSSKDKEDTLCSQIIHNALRIAYLENQ